MKKIYSLCALIAFSVMSFAQGTYTLVTNVNDLADAEYLIVGKIYSETDGNRIYALGAQTNNNRSAVLFSDTDSKSFSFESTADYGKIKVAKEVGTNNIYTFQDTASALYLYAASSSGNQLKSKEAVDASAKFTVTIDAITGEATVVSTDATVRGNFRFNSTNNPPLFSCYNDTSSVVNKIYFYKKEQTASTKDNNIKGLAIYPNPTSDILNITTPLNAEKEVVVYDILGKEVLKTKTQQVVKVGNLTPGVYLVKVLENGKTSTQKIVIK